jgi:hypothetical protein
LQLKIKIFMCLFKPSEVLAVLGDALSECGLPTNTMDMDTLIQTPPLLKKNVRTRERLIVRMVDECCPKFTSKVMHISRGDSCSSSDYAEQQQNSEKPCCKIEKQPTPPYIFVGQPRIGIPGTVFQDDQEDWRLNRFFDDFGTL